MVVGIFERLTRHGKESLIKCESLLPLSGSDPKALIQYNSTKNFETNGSIPNEWWQISVDRYFISPKSYRIRTCNFPENNSHPKTWNLSASSNNVTWTIIDSQKDRTDTNVASTDFSFKINNFETFFRYFRITLIESHAHSYPKRLSLNEFDVYGVIRSNIYATRCVQEKSLISFACQVVMLLLHK